MNDKNRIVDDENRVTDDHDANRDPLSGETGSHPVGTGIGAAGVGAAATAIGTVIGGPIGGVVGAVAGSVIGGLVGKGAAEAIDPTVEDDYWRGTYASRPYYETGRTYEDYQPAYQAGYEGYNTYYADGRTYEEVEPDLRRDYDSKYGQTGLAWEKAKHATRDAWDRMAHSRRP